MNVQEKRIRCRQFIASSNFTPAAHTVLALFNRNVQNLLNVVLLEGVLLEKIGKSEIDTGLPEDVLLEVKSFVLLDGLAKIMMMLEGFLALCEALSNPKKGYEHLAKSMARYDNKEINAFIKLFKVGKVKLWKLFRFPDIDRLNLESTEADFMRKLLNDSCRVFEETILKVIEFYECSRLAYNKLKHGFSIMAGMKLSGPEGAEYPSTLIYALDHWEAWRTIMSM